MDGDRRLEAARHDRLLLAAVVKRDEAALRLLYDNHAGLLLTIAHETTGSWGAAEEVVQDVFVQCWYRAATYNPARGSVAGWLVGITRNRATDYLRRANAAKRPEASALSYDRAVPTAFAGRAVLESQLDTMAIREALRELSQGERLAIILGVQGGLTQVEIAAALDTPLGTVKSWMRRGLERLRGRLMEMGVMP